MILNALSITVIFIGVLSALLAIWGGISSFVLYRRWKRPFIPEEKASLEDRSYLVLLIMVIVLVIRLFDWPLFYVTLQSFISDIEGAMCIFGVTQVRPGLTRFLEFLKPVNFFLIGGWFLLHLLDRATKTSPLMKRKLLLLSILSLLVLIDSSWRHFFDPWHCTGIARLLLYHRDRHLQPSHPEHTIIYFRPRICSLSSGPLFHHSHCPDRVRRRELNIGENISQEEVDIRLLFLFSFLNATLFLLSQVEVFAPAMMHLPFHHCLYCLWQYVPDSIVMYLFFILGTFSVGWGFTTSLFGRQGEAADLLPGYLRKIYWFAFFFLLASLIMLIIHLLVD